MVGLMVAVIVYTALAHNIHPPSNVETIDSNRLHLTEEFGEQNLGTQTNPDGSVTVRVVAARYGFYPPEIRVPEDTPVKLRWATPDVIHGVHAPKTNMSTMVVPGYVSEVNTVFPQPGEYSMLCNEYCGLGHHYMWGRLIVVPKGGS
jgi:cytochrome c oxidase subunit 2